MRLSQDINIRAEFLLGEITLPLRCAVFCAVLRCATPRYRQASTCPPSTLAVESDLQSLSAGDLLEGDAAGPVGIAGQGETVAEAGRAGGGVDDLLGGAGGAGGEGDDADLADVVGRGGVGVGGRGDPVEREDVDLGDAGAGYDRAGGEDGLELAAVGAGGDVVEDDEGVAVRERRRVGGLVQRHGDCHAVGGAVRHRLVDQVDDGREDGAAGARDQRGGWRGGGEEGGGQEGSCDGDCVHLGGSVGFFVSVLFWLRGSKRFGSDWRDGW